MKRIFTIMLALCLCVPLVAINAAADSLSGDSFVNILPSDSYDRYFNDSFESTQDKAYSYCSALNSVGYKWNCNIYDMSFYGGYFTVIADRRPDSLFCIPYSNGPSYLCEYVGSTGRFHQYYLNARVNFRDLYIKAVWDSSYTGNFGIASAQMVRNDADSVDTAHFTLSYRTLASGEDGVAEISVNNEKWSLPKGFTVAALQLYDVNCFVDVYPDERAFDSAQSISLLLNMDGPVATADVGAALLDMSKNTVTVLNVDNSVVANTEISDTEDQWHTYSCKLTADLSNLDLQDRIIRFYIPFDRLESQGSYHTTFNIAAISMLAPETVVPWYQVFFGWMYDLIHDTTDTISAGIDRVVDALSGGNQINQELNNAGQSMSDQADQMQQANDQMSAVSRPELDPNGLFDQFVNFDPGGLSLLSVITTNTYVTPMLVLVFTFALAAYVFFGKRR